MQECVNEVHFRRLKLSGPAELRGSLTSTASAPSAGGPRPPRPASRRSRWATRRTRRARRPDGRSASSPSASQACPTNMTIRWGSRRSASPRTLTGATSHSSLSSRTSVLVGLSPRSTAPPAPSAQRPAQEETHGGATAGQPAAVRGPGDAEGRDRLGGVPLDEAQRPAQRLQLDRDPLLILGVVDEPRRQAVVAGGAPVAQSLDRRVGRVGLLGRGLEVVTAPADADSVELPGPAGEQLGYGARGL